MSTRLMTGLVKKVTYRQTSGFISFYIPPLGLWESMADATLSIEAKCFPGLTACSTGRKR